MNAAVEQKEDVEVIELERAQPMMIFSDRRLDCECGTLAIYLGLQLDPDFPEDRERNRAVFYCQACFESMQK